jgi:Fur family ferric uptake transcriptional regulator
VCRSCGVVIALDQAQQQPLAALVQDHTGFEVDIGHLSIPGLCADCRVAQITVPE